MREIELLTTPAVADTAEIKNEPQPVQEDNVSIYRFGRSVYKVKTHFNLECKETLADIVGRLIWQDMNETDN